MLRERLIKTMAVAILALPVSACAEGDEPVVVDGSTRGIGWGEHWAGPKLKRASDLEGKVVLLKIWGG